MDPPQGICSLLHCQHCLGVEVGRLDRIHLDYCEHSKAHGHACGKMRLTWVSRVSRVPAIRSSSFSLRLLLSQSRRGHWQCQYARYGQTSQPRGLLRFTQCSRVGAKDSQRLFVVALALAFFISSSIFFCRCSSFFSSMTSCVRSTTMASRAPSRLSFRRVPVKYDIQPDMVASVG